MDKAQAIKLLEAALERVKAGDDSAIDPLIEPLTSLNNALGEDTTGSGQPGIGMLC